jgi:hypothetical protein
MKASPRLAKARFDLRIGWRQVDAERFENIG